MGVCDPPLLPTFPEPSCHQMSPVGPQMQGLHYIHWVTPTGCRLCPPIHMGAAVPVLNKAPVTVKPCSVTITKVLPSVANFGASFALLFKLSLFQKTPVSWLLLNPGDGLLHL